MSEYLGEHPIKVTVSPPRVAYLVHKGDADAFSRAVEVASSRWAGLTEPIVSLCDDHTIDPGDIEIVETLDVVCAVGIGIDTTILRKGTFGLSIPIITGNVLERSRATRSLPWHAVASDRGSTPARDGGPLWERVAAGVDPQGTGSGIAMTEDNAGRAALNGRTLLEAGLGGLTETEATPIYGGPITLWITEPNSLEDCQRFWNHRALRCLKWSASPMYLVPINAFDDWLGFTDTVRSLVEQRQFNGSPDLVLNSLSVKPSLLRRAGDQLGLRFVDSQELVLPAGRNISGPDLKEDFTYAINVDPAEWTLHERSYGYDEWFRVQTFRTGTSVPVLPPSLESVIREHPGLPLQFNLSSGFIADLPRTPSTARAVFESASWSHGSLRSTVGISDRALLTINAPAAEDLLSAVVADLPAQTVVSDKGRLAASLAQRRGVEELLNTQSLAAIQALTTRRSKELVAQIKRLQEPLAPDITELVSRLGGRVERNSRTATTLGADGLGPAHALIALERLADEGWAERGLQIKCVACGIASFVAIKTASGPATCPQCRAKSAYTRSTADLQTLYRLDAFVDRCSDQGVITHVAVGRALLASHSYSALHLGADLRWPNGDLSEIDLLGFLGPKLVAGEVKTSAAEFTSEQMSRDIELSRRLGVDIHVLAYTRPTADDAFIETAAEACTHAQLDLVVVRPDASGTLAVDHV